MNSHMLRFRPRNMAPTFSYFLFAAIWLIPAGTMTYLAIQLGWSAGKVIFAFIAVGLVLAGLTGNVVRSTFGPIFFHELRILGRRRRTFIVRFLFSFSLAGLLAFLLRIWLNEIGYFDRETTILMPWRIAEFGQTAFEIVTVVQFVLILFLTPVYTAGVITDEKERNTLEFLFATDLRGREILFGKLAARTTILIMFVLAGLPIIGCLQLFGGVDPNQALAANLAMIITILGIGALGLFFSTVLKRSRDAITTTYLVLLLYFAFSWIVADWIKQTYAAGTTGIQNWEAGLGDLIAAGNPIYITYSLKRLVAAKGGVVFSASETPEILLRYFVFWGFIGGALLSAAAYRIRAIALGQTAKKATKHRDVTRSTKPVGEDPMYWKEVHFRGRRSWKSMFFEGFIVFLIFAYPIMEWREVQEKVGNLSKSPLYMYYKIDTNVDFIPIFVLGKHHYLLTERFRSWVGMSTAILGVLAMFSAAIRGASAVRREFDQDTWISLITSLLTPKEMIWAKWHGCVLGSWKNPALISLIWLMGAHLGAVQIMMLPIVFLLYAIYVATAAWIGLYFSISAPTSLGAVLRAFLCTFFLCGGQWLLLYLLIIIPLKSLDYTAATMLQNTSVLYHESLGQILFSLTPPAMLNWLALPNFDFASLGPYYVGGSHSGIGLLAPLTALGIWIWFYRTVRAAAYWRFLDLSNRYRKLEVSEHQGIKLRQPAKEPKVPAAV